MSRKPIPDQTINGEIMRVCTSCKAVQLTKYHYQYKTGVNAGKFHRRCIEYTKKYMRDWWRKNNSESTEADTKGATEVTGEGKEGNGPVAEGSVPSAPAGGSVVLHSKPKGARKGIKLDRSRGGSRRQQAEVL